ncbi:right-handed parallel beta-helix repeat-containing protein [Sphingobium sufflavum]|uniref:right-handed parallel beta-helix repeat-containing protein n=1 Tax=Sphingobium sufflavum TaxID=1129547 RepID=UPI001F358472|nr:right-handed parallel beta-helix repeat-containing protein [Sphingobium sufflavum]MCE7798511.1 right-handed parallel beta-helix repeat-containing protein [Sphingobium sufflavum]
MSALKNAKNGDVIKLAEGEYSAVNIKNIDIPGNVTITSANAKNPAVFTDLAVRNSSGLTFSNIEFSEKVAGRDNGFLVLGSSDIHFDKLDVHGLANLGSGKESALMLIRNSSDISVTNSEFSNGQHGLGLLDNDGVTVTGNSFHDLRTDGVRGGGTSNLVIDGNMFTDFYPGEGDHPDAIQLWTTNTNRTAENITITNNLITRGDGEPVQGIFLRDQLGVLPYENVTITGNMVVGGMYNGIAVNGVNGGVIANNTVLGVDGQKSWIRTDAASDFAVKSNLSTSYMLAAGQTGSTANKVALDPLDGGAGAVFTWLTAKGGLAAAAGASVGAIMSALKLNLNASSFIPDADRITTINGTWANDQLKVAAIGNSKIVAGAGDDVITGGGADGSKHSLYGGAGDDKYLIRSSGDKVIELANGGTDIVSTRISYSLTEHVEDLRLEVGGLVGEGNGLANRITGSSGEDEVYGLGGDDIIQTGEGDDYLNGGDGNDTLRGDGGNDTLDGGAGSDTLLGGTGDDLLYGGGGADILEGGAGADKLFGGAGADQFRFRQDDLQSDKIDMIMDFARGTDRISLSLADANINTSANDAFKFIGTKAFSHVAGQLRYDVVNGSAHVYGDLNGDGVKDFELVINKVATLAATDFIL